MYPFPHSSVQLLLFPDDEPEPTERPKPLAKVTEDMREHTREQVRSLAARETPEQVVHDNTWYAPLRSLQSRGSQTTVVGGLAGLHEARRLHEGQFFTPDAVASLMWSIVRMDSQEAFSGDKIRILDNTFGSGRLFQFADPQKHQLFGIEKDAELARFVQSAVQAAGFEAQLLTGSLEEFRMPRRSLDVAFLNPPFSIHLDTPHVEPYP